MAPRTLQFLIPLLILLPILYFRMRRSMKPQRLKPQNLLIRPAFIILVAILVLYASPPRTQELQWYILAAVIGGAAGWYWGKTTRLELHPEDGTILSTSSQAGMLVPIVLVLFRYGVRAGIGVEQQAMHLDLPMVTDISITFSALLFSARGLEIFLRAKDLLKGKT